MTNPIAVNENCRICTWSGRPRDSFLIDNAPISVNDLPFAGSAPGQDVRRLALWECPDCGHMQLREECRPDSWRAAVTAAGLSAEMRGQRKALFARMRAMTDRATVLEVGAGEGLFLDLLAQAGFVPSGLEWSKELVDKGRLKGRPLIEGHVLDGALDGQQLDNFVSINFLEHATKPAEMMKRIAAACRPGSIGLVEVPNFEKNLETERSHDLVAEHLSYFTMRTLRLCMELSGLEVISMEPFWHGDDIIAWVTPRQPRALSDWGSRDPAVRLIRSFLGSGSCTCAIWGASHQALTLLAMLEVESAGRFFAIADSSPRKQGRMDPAWGIPIISPEEMVSANPGQVLIMAAGYSDEVAGLLRSMGYRGRAAILADGHLREVE